DGALTRDLSRRGCQRFFVTGFHQLAVQGFGHYVGNTTDPGCHDGHSCCEAFDDRHWCALVLRGKGGQIEVAENPFPVEYPSAKCNSVAELELACEAPQVFQLVAVADNRQVRVNRLPLEHPCEGAQQERGVLDFRQAPDSTYEYGRIADAEFGAKPSAFAREPCTPREVESKRNDSNLVRSSDAIFLNELPADSRAHGYDHVGQAR